MGFFNDLMAKRAAARLSDEALYAIALREIESGIRRDGIWAQALSDSSMDQARAAARYITLRVQALRDELALTKRTIEEGDEADLPKHRSCGGVLDRHTVGRTIKWTCRKCRAKGQFALGGE